MAKKDDLARSRAFLRPLILTSSSGLCFSRLFIVRCSSCIFALCSGCFSRTLQQLMLVQGSFLVLCSNTAQQEKLFILLFEIVQLTRRHRSWQSTRVKPSHFWRNWGIHLVGLDVDFL